MRRLCIILALAGSLWSAEARIDNGERVVRLVNEVDMATDAVDKIAICDTLMELASRMPFSTAKGNAYKTYAAIQQEYGDQITAHNYYWQAIDILEQSEGNNAKSISDCYYRMAVDYLNAQDTVNLKSTLAKLEELVARSADHLIAHDYYSILTACYTVVIDLEPDRRDELRQPMLEAGKMAIANVEALVGTDDYYLVNPVWDYFNVALCYNDYFDPPLADSTALYLDLAEAITRDMKRQEVIRDESMISISDLRAWLALERGDYREAERRMNRVVELLDKNEKLRPNTLITERNETYRFFVELAVRRGNWRKAFEYQKLLTASNKLRYDIEKTEAIDNVRTKFAIEKRQQRIADLEASNRLTITMLIIAVVMLIVLTFGIMFLVLYSRQRKANMEQRLYETALNAELRQRELSTIRQSLTVSPAASTIEALKAQIASSLITEEVRDTYLNALDALSAEMLDKMFLSSAEPITSMDRKYVVCFMISMTTADIGVLFNIEPASVYVVRYRIKKKFDYAPIPF